MDVKTKLDRFFDFSTNFLFITKWFRQKTWFSVKTLETIKNRKFGKKTFITLSGNNFFIQTCILL